MGLVHADITLTNLADLDAQAAGVLTHRLRQEMVHVMVDTGALHLVITPDMQSLLELPVRSQVRSVLANGQRVIANMVGPVELRFANRSTICQALVIPGAEECLLGAIPMEGLDVVIDPSRQTLRVNPDSPDMPLAALKGVPRIEA